MRTMDETWQNEVIMNFILKFGITMLGRLSGTHLKDVYSLKDIAIKCSYAVFVDGEDLINPG